jgi:hypothetical protein
MFVVSDPVFQTAVVNIFRRYMVRFLTLRVVSVSAFELLNKGVL